MAVTLPYQFCSSNQAVTLCACQQLSKYEQWGSWVWPHSANHTISACTNSHAITLRDVCKGVELDGTGVP